MDRWTGNVLFYYARQIKIEDASPLPPVAQKWSLTTSHMGAAAVIRRQSLWCGGDVVWRSSMDTHTQPITSFIGSKNKYGRRICTKTNIGVMKSTWPDTSFNVQSANTEETGFMTYTDQDGCVYKLYIKMDDTSPLALTFQKWRFTCSLTF